MRETPSYTKRPNYIVDDLGWLEGSELKVLDFLLRHTAGYQRPSCRFSVRKVASGTYQTVLTVRRALATLERIGAIVRGDTHQTKGTEYGVSVPDYEEVKALAKERGVLMSDTLEPQGVLVSDTVLMSDTLEPQGVLVSDTLEDLKPESSVLMSDTGEGDGVLMSDTPSVSLINTEVCQPVTHMYKENFKETIKEIEIPAPPSAAGSNGKAPKKSKEPETKNPETELFHAIKTRAEELWGYAVKNFAREAKAFKQLADLGFTVEQYEACYLAMKADRFFADKHLSACIIVTNGPAWLKSHAEDWTNYLRKETKTHVRRASDTATSEEPENPDAVREANERLLALLDGLPPAPPGF